MKEKEIERLTKLKEIEKDLYNKGFKNICGIDEAGRGPLAGPVVVAGVIMPQDSMIEFVNDSKKVTEKSPAAGIIQLPGFFRSYYIFTKRIFSLSVGSSATRNAVTLPSLSVSASAPSCRPGSTCSSEKRK